MPTRGGRQRCDRVQRIWRREGLKVPRKQRPRGRLWLNDGSCIRLRPQHRNHVWSYDFVEVQTHDGRKLLIRTACNDACIASALIGAITEKIRCRLKDDPQTTFRFNLFCGQAAGPTEWTNVRVEFFREDWTFILENLPDSDSGDWNEETLRYECDFFDLSANAVDNEIVVTFW